MARSPRMAPLVVRRRAHAPPVVRRRVPAPGAPARIPPGTPVRRATRTTSLRPRANPSFLTLLQRRIGLAWTKFRSAAAILKRGWEGKYTARRFFCCPIEDRREQCMFVHWINEPWPRPLQDSLKKLWSELRMTRRCNYTCTDALEEALRCNDIANAARVKLQEEVESTKKHAERAIISFRKQAAEVSVDKSKIMYLVYCLLGLIAFLVSALVLLLIKN